jgi:hypothetical protein
MAGPFDSIQNRKSRVPERSLGEPLGEPRRSRRVLPTVARPFSPYIYFEHFQ